MKIKSIHAYEIIASGGYPSLEAEVTLEDGTTASASVPYGVSDGTYEAALLTDHDKSRWHGQGMLQAATNVTDKIAPALFGLDAADQRAVDERLLELDGTPNKSNLGGNTILAASLSVARAAALSQGIALYRHVIDTFQTGVDLTKLPKPMAVVIEGGKHAHDTTDLQEYCLTATREASVTDNLRMILETYHELAGVLKKNNLSTNVGNEGAFAPSGIKGNEAPFTFLTEAIKNAGYQAGTEIGISIDAAASEFYEGGMYHLKLENRVLSADELILYFGSWLDKYPITTFEDMLDEDDWEHWPILKSLTDQHHIPLIGDDLTVTNTERLRKAIDTHSISGVLIKLNQIGTLTETLDTCAMANKHGLMTVTSHRGGGETNDTAMIDLAVAVGSAYVKVGPTRGERVAKYNRLMAIERELQVT